MKITYSACVWDRKIKAQKLIERGFETSDKAMEYMDKFYTNQGFIITRDHVNSDGDYIASNIVCRSKPKPKTI